MGLNCEFNIDEYEPEARTMLPSLFEARNNAEVETIVLEESAPFLMVGPSEALQKITKYKH